MLIVTVTPHAHFHSRYLHVHFIDLQCFVWCLFSDRLLGCRWNIERSRTGNYPSNNNTITAAQSSSFISACYGAVGSRRAASGISVRVRECVIITTYYILKRVFIYHSVCHLSASTVSLSPLSRTIISMLVRTISVTSLTPSVCSDDCPSLVVVCLNVVCYRWILMVSREK